MYAVRRRWTAQLARALEHPVGASPTQSVYTPSRRAYILRYNRAAAPVALRAVRFISEHRLTRNGARRAAAGVRLHKLHMSQLVSICPVTSEPAPPGAMLLPPTWPDG